VEAMEAVEELHILRPGCSTFRAPICFGGKKGFASGKHIFLVRAVIKKFSLFEITVSPDFLKISCVTKTCHYKVTYTVKLRR